MNLSFQLSNGNVYKTNSSPSLLFLGILLFALNQLSIALLVSTLVHGTKNSFKVSLITLFLPLALGFYLIYQRYDQVLNGQQTNPFFELSYCVPNVPFYLIIAEFYIEGAG